ncbi:MAG TPA: GtrA family protein [Bradyrhizobium sp.]|nr:GtrA family protein [Bradyrhizobium sp.]
MNDLRRLGPIAALRQNIPAHAQAELARLIRYGIAGGITAIFFFLTIYLCVDGLGLSLSIATALGWAVAVPMNFLTHKIWSFESQRSYGHSIPRYAFALLCSFAINLAIAETLVRYFSMHYLLAQLLAVPALLATNYGTLRLWVFRPLPPAAEVTGDTTKPPA